MYVLTTGAFWAATFERAAKTAGQAFVLSIGTTAILTEIDWAVVAGATAVAAILSVGTSIASIPIGDSGPSLGPERLAPPVQANQPKGI